MVTNLGRVDFGLDVPSSCLAAQPVLPVSYLPKQIQADRGTLKFLSTQHRLATTSVTLYVIFFMTTCCSTVTLGVAVVDPCLLNTMVADVR